MLRFVHEYSSFDHFVISKQIVHVKEALSTLVYAGCNLIYALPGTTLLQLRLVKQLLRKGAVMNRVCN